MLAGVCKEPFCLELPSLARRLASFHCIHCERPESGLSCAVDVLVALSGICLDSADELKKLEDAGV